MKRRRDISGERCLAGSLSRATAGSEAALQVLAAAGRVCVRTWRETPHGGYPLNCTPGHHNPLSTSRFMRKG